MNAPTLQRRIVNLKPFMETAATIPDRRMLLYRPVYLPIDKDSPGIWTDVPAFTAAALWKRVEWIWKQPDKTPALQASLEHSIDCIETIEAWTKEQST